MQDVRITIATGISSRSKSWKHTDLTWSDLVKKLRNSTQTNETLKEFVHASKEEQHRVKDVGGYVGGYLRNGKRSPENVVHRQLLTLDVDFATSDFFDDYCLLFDNAAFIHATHKHSELEPRYRLLLPLDRECSPDEYVAVARRIAGSLGIEAFDNTTFEVNRLMFWPSHPRDVKYYCEEQKGPILSVDDVLDSYLDWKDTSLWPTADKRLREIGDAARKQEDPAMKRGVVGAFCRTYGIESAIEKFLSDVYAPTAVDGRYTYVDGTTACGLILYDDVFAYSHHGTDPAGGKLCNAFDLVRVHHFGHLDDNDKSNRSFVAMEELCRADKAVRKTLARENLDEAREAFGDALTDVPDEAFDWMTVLEIDSKGGYLSTANNINLILQNDTYLKEAFKYNEFDGKRYIVKSMPWRKVERAEPVRNVDHSGVRNYIECVYGINSQLKIDDSMTLEVERLSYHPIREYLEALEWDGISRIDTLLVDYFGTVDNIYTREAMRKMLCGAVARVMTPGVKFDLVLTLVGGQGTGKSSFLKILGKEWFSDTFMTVQGKDALEQIQGAWLIEMAELSGLRKAEVEAVKHFISKQQDQFRPAYARVSETFDRQCVFFGTTNNAEFLRDPSGNRRFLPIDVQEQRATKDVFTDLAEEVDQIWAEARHLHRKGERLFLGSQAENLARAEQSAHSESDERSGLIQKYLETRLPKKWASLDLYDRQDYLNAEEHKGKEARRFVCVAEIWCECLGKNKEEMSRYATKDINDIMRSLPNWKGHLSTKNFGEYGKQRFYERVENA